MTQAKLLAGCFALMAVINAGMFFVNFPDYFNAALAILCGIVSYKVFKSECAIGQAESCTARRNAKRKACARNPERAIKTSTGTLHKN